jgi:hypothetical protein
MNNISVRPIQMTIITGLVNIIESGQTVLSKNTSTVYILVLVIRKCLKLHTDIFSKIILT